MILVTGATGTIGGQVVRRLLKDGDARVRALTRDPDGAELPGGVEIVQGDLAEPASLDAALDGVERVFLVWPNLVAEHAAPETVKKLARDGRAPRHIVYFSSAEAGAADPINASHGEIERLVRESGAGWTFLRITGLATNDRTWAQGVRAEGVVREPSGSWTRSLIHEADIAAVAARVLAGDGHDRATYELTGPQALTAPERVAILGEVLGRPLRFEKEAAEETRRKYEALMGPEAAQELLAELALESSPERVTDTVRELTGCPARTYREWAVDHARDFAPGGRGPG